MKHELYSVYGASGFGREVLPLLREQLKNEGVSVDQLVLVDDSPPSHFINDHKVITYEHFLSDPFKKRFVCVAIADSNIRQKVSEKILSDGMQLITVIAENVVVMDDVTIGEGSVLCNFVTLTSNISIGKSFHANLYSYVAHDCQIGDYVTFAPGVKCNGNVVIDDHAYIGTGAIIKQGKPGQPLVIGKNAVVGMGAVVTKDVSVGEVVVGNPAKPLVRNNSI